jgi:hypothetical protein
MDSMPRDNRIECCPHLAELREYAASGLKNILDCAEEMKLKTDALPDELKPYGEAMTKFSMEALITSYVERLRLISELGLRDITRAALPPEQQTEEEVFKEEK